MIIDIEQNDSFVRITFEREENDRTLYRRARSDRTECEVWAPDGVSFDQVHPDLLALAAFLVVQPWVGRRLTFRGARRPGDRFCKALAKAFGIRAFGADSAVIPRLAPVPGRPGLAFSAGMDSTAALALMPQDTVSVFLNRVGLDRTPINSNYRNDFAMHAIQELQKLGRQVLIVDSNLEYTRRPVGFPVDWSNAVPAVLLADEFGLRSIAWGMILESAYAIGSVGFRDWPDRDLAQKWGAVFEAAGLPMSAVVSGLSEVCTSKVVMASPYANLAQSCIRGTVDRACGECPKCFRKGLLESALGGRSFDEDRLDCYLKSDEIRAILSAYPIKHENVLGYCLSQYAGAHPFLLALKDRLRVDDVDYRLFERYYPAYLQSVPDVERNALAGTLNACLAPMTAEEQERIRTWRITELAEDPSLAEKQQHLLSLIDA